MQIPHILPTHNPDLLAVIDAAINSKTKPPGSLGMLESLALQLGLIQQTARPSVQSPTILVIAADHGIADENISAYPQSVTWQMVENFLGEGAAINVFARQSGCALQIVDAGVKHDFGTQSGLTNCKVGLGTRNFARHTAMDTAQRDAAMQHGADLVTALAGNVVGFGEMGIGNTTSAAALMHKLTAVPVADCVGAGTGLDAAGVLHKQRVVQGAVDLHDGVDAPLEVLATFGGFEIALMVGAMLAAAEQRKVILVDGFIVTSALLVAVRLQPAILDYCVFSHCSDEKGHRKMLQCLGGQPLLQLGLRLGEGTACALALPLLQAAVNFLEQMATFDSAGVSAQTA